MPGINITTAARSGTTTTPAPPSARFFVAGLLERGPAATPVLVSSLAGLERAFGARVAYGSVYDNVKTFFEEGGAEAVVVRTVGPGSTVGTRTLDDDAGAPSLRFDAIGPGLWSTRVALAVSVGTAPGTFRVRVYLDARQEEVFDNLTLADVSARVDASAYVRATTLGGGPPAALPYPAPLPANVPPTLTSGNSLSAGSDDRASVTAATVAASLGFIGEGFGGGGAVALPGYPANLVGAALTAHAVAFRRVALLAPAIATTSAAVQALADTLVGADGDHAALIYPWVRIPAGPSTRTISAEGYAAGVRARAHRDVGPWAVPAGEVASARFILAPERVINRAEGDQLDAARVSVIRSLAGATRMYGWRSLSLDEANFGYLVGRDVLNSIAVQCEAALEGLIFQPIDGRGQYLSKVATRLVGVLEPMRSAGGLFERVVDGEEIDPGYSVDVSDAINPTSQLAVNVITATVGARVSPFGAVINLLITKAGADASV